MDPTQTLKNMLSAYAVGDYDAGDEATSILINWLDNGGFLPRLSKLSDDEARQLLNMVFTYVSELA